MLAQGLLTAALLVPAGAGDLSPTPVASLDLATEAGAALARAEWRYADARLVEVDFRAAGAEGQPTGPPVRTWDLTPHAGGTDFDDSGWERISPEGLAARRGHGRLAFAWYRVRVTLPERVGDFETRGSTVVFETSVDDYAEVWVDGELPRLPGQSGGSVIAGWNAANRVVIARGARPGQQVQLAVFGANGPLSSPPTNFVWMRSARLEFYEGDGSAAPRAVPPQEVNVEVERLDPRLDAIVGPNPKLYKLAEGFEFTEGPVWIAEGGYLLFSDPNANRIYRYSPEGEGRLDVFREASGYLGADLAEYGQPGSNGLAVDAQGRLIACEHGRHRVSRTERDGSVTTLADAWQGRRLNSPNDLILRSDGTLYFSDPPFGLPRFFDDPRRELDFSGVFRIAPDGTLHLEARELAGPNGVALSPDERFLYVTNWDESRKVVVRHPVAPGGSLGAGELFFDMTGAPGAEALDGIEVDRDGNLYVSGPGGLWVLAPDATHLGTIRGPRLAANFAWGDADGRSLYWTARSGLYRMRLGVPGNTNTRGAASASLQSGGSR